MVVGFVMYGMVNNAIREHALATWGEEVWRGMADAADIPVDGCATLQPYADAKTIALLVAAAEHSGAPLEQILRDVGRAWVAYAGLTTFAPLLATAGTDAATMIENLDAMHTHIKASLPELVMPRFSCQRGADGALDVVYSSEREGLFPFVEGLFEGMAARFGQGLDILEFTQLSASSARWRLRFREAEHRAA